MLRALRAIVLAVVVAASLLASGSVASANSLPGGKVKLPPAPAQVLDITWE
ncbi:MAG TPA: hypothetical protein VKR80_00865 [Candidatus Limnocylindria bacterium]|nr:hypothetical protein [Candidatus Limnocylindria bacterium]